MSEPYSITRATTTDLTDVMSLINQRIEWLRRSGNDQWNTGRTFEDRILESIQRGETWIIHDDNQAIATLSLTTVGDGDFWTTQELEQSALYLGKMASSLARRGENLGLLMLHWAQDHAARLGIPLIRWDVWKTNERLQKYYRDNGGKYLRSVEAPGRWSGALFELEARARPELHARLVTVT